MLQKILKRASEKGLTQSDLARVAAVDPARITEWKKSEWQPNIGQFARIGRHLGLSLDYLADDSLDEPPSQPEPLSFDAQTVLAIIDALDLKLSDVIRALNALSMRPSDSRSGGHAAVIGIRNLTASDDLREEQEGLAREADGDNKGSKLEIGPAGKR